LTIARRRILRDRRAGIGPLVALAMPVLIGAGALAVDVGSVQLETRRLQGLADSAALAAATDLPTAQSRADALVADSGWEREFDVVATPGRYVADPAIASAERFTPGATPANAVQVALETRSPTFLARIFGTRDVAIGRRARAARIDLAAISVGSRLAALDGGLVNAYLSALTGSNVSLSVADYNALAGADIDLLGFVDALNTTADLELGSYDRILDSDVALPQIVEAIGMASADDALAKALLARIAAGMNVGDTVNLSTLIDLGPVGAQDRAAAGMVKVNALAMLTSVLQLANGERQVALDLGAGIPGLAQTRVWLAVGQRPEGSPWIAIGDGGHPIVRTAQVRVYVETRLANVSLPGLGSLVGINVPLFVELAEAEARIDAIACPTPATARVDVGARPGLGTIALGEIDTRRLDDFSRAMAVQRTKLVDTLLVDVEARGVIALGSAEPWQRVSFSSAQIGSGEPQTVSSGAAVQGLTASLIQSTTLTPRVLGLPIPTGPLLSGVGQALNVAAPAIDGVINLATGTLGVRYGQADVWVNGIRCGQPVLVG
jgi:uncharacterized membrane protein